MTEETLFEAALAVPEPGRAAWLDRECGARSPLRARVDALLAAHAQSQHLVDQAAPMGTLSLGADLPKPRPREPATSDPTGLVLSGKYKLLQKIGEGGMGTVWLAQQSEPVKRRVAVKLIKLGMDSRQVLHRFEAERQALAMMDHPNIAKVLDGGLSADGRPFFVMELVKGTPITEYCDAAKLGVKDRLNLFVQVCQAIQHAHQKGIIHRDIKPSNVLIAQYDDRPVPRVIDFGVAKATGQSLTEGTIETGFGGVVGTPQYMSPEQATLNNLDIDTRSDVYSLGVLLYELLTGTPPLTREELLEKGIVEMLRVVREEEPQKPSTRLSTADALPTISANRREEPRRLTEMLRSELDWIALKALEKNRSRRYETASGLAADINRYLQGEPVLAHPPSTAYRLQKFIRRHRPQVITAVAVLLALLVGIAGTTFGLIRANEFAEGEKAARSRVEIEKANAERSAGAEKAANAQAQKRLKQIEKANDVLGSIFESLDPSEIARKGQPLQSMLVEKLNKAVEQLEGESIGDPVVVANMQQKFSRSLIGLGETKKGLILGQKALATHEALLGPDDQATITDMNYIGLAHSHASRPDLAIPVFEEAYKRAKRRGQAGDEHALALMNNLAQSYLSAGKQELGLPLLEEARRLVQAKFGPMHLGTLTATNNLGLAYLRSGKAAQAVPLLEEVLRTTTLTVGSAHPITLTCIDNLAGAYLAVGKKDLAIDLYEQAVNSARVTLGVDHDQTLTSMNNLANAYRDAGKLEKALPLNEETLKLMTAKLGADHIHTVYCMFGMARTYAQAKKPALAVPLFEKTLKYQVAILGSEDPETILTMDYLAGSYLELKRYTEAIPLYQRSVKYYEAKFGRDNLGRYQSSAYLAVSYLGVGREPDALPLLEEVHQGVAKFPNELRSFSTLLVQVYQKLGLSEKAAQTQRELVAEASKADPNNLLLSAGKLASLGFVLIEQGSFIEAEQLIRQALAIREKEEPEGWLTFNTRSMLGAALMGQKRYAEAEPLLLAGYAGIKDRQKDMPLPAKSRLPIAADRLIELYTLTNQPEKREKWVAERAAYPGPATRAAK